MPKFDDAGVTDVKCKLPLIAVHFNLFILSYKERDFLQLLARFQKIRFMLHVHACSLFVVVRISRLNAVG